MMDQYVKFLIFWYDQNKKFSALSGTKPIVAESIPNMTTASWYLVFGKVNDQTFLAFKMY